MVRGVPYRVHVIIRGGSDYDHSIGGPLTLQREGATEDIRKVREAKLAAEGPGNAAARWVDLDWICADARDIVAAYVVDEAELPGGGATSESDYGASEGYPPD